MTPKQWDEQARRIRKSRTGCTCVRDKHPREVRCTEMWVRCNGTLNVMNERLKKLGPRPTG